MNIEALVQGDQLKYVDRDGITRNGRVVRNRTTDAGRLFLTVESTMGQIEVIRDKTKVLSLGWE